MATDTKLRFYQAEADRFRFKAATESCADAREYYEALERDYIKLASMEFDAVSANSDGESAK